MAAFSPYRIPGERPAAVEPLRPPVPPVPVPDDSEAELQPIACAIAAPDARVPFDSREAIRTAGFIAIMGVAGGAIVLIAQLLFHAFG